MQRHCVSSTAISTRVGAAVLVTVFASCVTDGVGTIECENGLVCPPQTVCVAVSPADPMTDYRCDPDGCGDGIVDRRNGEACDDGNRVAGDGCSASCRIIESCGDGKLDPGEGCDPSAPESTVPCGDDCRPLLNCGDGEVNPMEDCDEGINGTPRATPTCNDNCGVPWCGDGNTNRSFVNPATGRPEECDGGEESTAECDADCTFAECGDGLRSMIAGEECDEEAVDTPSCDKDCSLPKCGDGYINEAAGEQCGESTGADGMPVTPVDGSTCDADCTPPACGDGHTNQVFGETCDDGSGSATCNGPDAPADLACAFTTCGDGYRTRPRVRHATTAILLIPTSAHPDLPPATKIRGHAAHWHSAATVSCTTRTAARRSATLTPTAWIAMVPMRQRRLPPTRLRGRLPQRGRGRGVRGVRKHRHVQWP